MVAPRREIKPLNNITAPERENREVVGEVAESTSRPVSSTVILLKLLVG